MKKELSDISKKIIKCFGLTEKHVIVKNDEMITTPPNFTTTFDDSDIHVTHINIYNDWFNLNLKIMESYGKCVLIFDTKFKSSYAFCSKNIDFTMNRTVNIDIYTSEPLEDLQDIVNEYLSILIHAMITGEEPLAKLNKLYEILKVNKDYELVLDDNSFVRHIGNELKLFSKTNKSFKDNQDFINYMWENYKNATWVMFKPSYKNIGEVIL